jgi:CHAD domain-containing protein
MRVDEAVRMIMRQLLEIMRAYETGVSTGQDAACLHEFRIAVRRHRVLLGQLHGVIPQRSLMRLRKGFTWLGEMTTEQRDLDVYLTTLADSNRDLAPLQLFYQQQRQLAHQQLAADLASPRYTQLMSFWIDYLATPLPVHSRLLYAQFPLADFASQHIWRMVRRVLKQGGAISADSPPQVLHELRKSCKKLRYLMEFFQSLYPQKKMNKALKVLKVLQDLLGEYQDLQVQQAFLTSFKQQAGANIPVYALTAVYVRMSKMHKREVRLRQLFERQFAEFAEQRYTLFKRLFKADKTASLKHARG